MWIKDITKFQCATQDSRDIHCPRVAEYEVKNILTGTTFRLCICCKINFLFKEIEQGRNLNYTFLTPICNHKLNEEFYCTICGKDCR